MKLNKIGKVWNSVNKLLSDFIGLLSCKNFATMATWCNDFSLLVYSVRLHLLWVYSYTNEQECKQWRQMNPPIHCFASGAKMASRFKTFLEDGIWPINEAVVQRNTRKATNFGLSVFTRRQEIIFMLNLQQKSQNHLTKSPKCLKIVKKVPTKWRF